MHPVSTRPFGRDPGRDVAVVAIDGPAVDLRPRAVHRPDALSVEDAGRTELKPDHHRPVVLDNDQVVIGGVAPVVSPQEVDEPGDLSIDEAVDEDPAVQFRRFDHGIRQDLGLGGGIRPAARQIKATNVRTVRSPLPPDQDSKNARKRSQLRKQKTCLLVAEIGQGPLQEGVEDKAFQTADLSLP